MNKKNFIGILVIALAIVLSGCTESPNGKAIKPMALNESSKGHLTDNGKKYVLGENETAVFSDDGKSLIVTTSSSNVTIGTTTYKCACGPSCGGASCGSPTLSGNTISCAGTTCTRSNPDESTRTCGCTVSSSGAPA